jgi:hypothetical protein
MNALVLKENYGAKHKLVSIILSKFLKTTPSRRIKDQKPFPEAGVHSQYICLISSTL